MSNLTNRNIKQVHFNKHVSINLLVKEQKFNRGTISKFKY